MTDEQIRTAAGYKDAPLNLRLRPPIDALKLRGKNIDVVPIPKSTLHGDMHGDNKGVVIGSSGLNLLESSNERRLKKLEAVVSSHSHSQHNPLMLGSDVVPKLEETPLPKSEGDDQSDDADDVDETKDKSESTAIKAMDLPEGNLVKHDTDPIDHILSLPLAKEMGIKAEHISINRENQDEIMKSLHDPTSTILVKPFSIPAGIIGQGKLNGKNCLVAYDQPDIVTGQPGQMLAIFEKSTFSLAPKNNLVYNPDIDVVDQSRQQESIMESGSVMDAL